MENIIIVGDSFCSSAEHWPRRLANKINLNLICHGIGGQSWWNVRKFLFNLDNTILETAAAIVFVHTNSGRLPTSNETIGQINHNNLSDDEIGQSVRLYYKYIHDPEFLTWAQQQWFREISMRWGSKKLIHLHSFPWSLPCADLLKGTNVTTNLTAISLNEISAKKVELFNDPRPNHFNEHNNNELANQLAELLLDYHEGNVELDIDRFDQPINIWLSRSDWS